MAINPLLPRIVYAVSNAYGTRPGGGDVSEQGGVFRTTDRGKTWVCLNGDLVRSPLTASCIALNPRDPSRIFVGLRGPGGYRARDLTAWKMMRVRFGAAMFREALLPVRSP